MKSSCLNLFQQNYKTLFSLYENERLSFTSSKKGQTHFYKNLNEYKNFILMGVILHNYKNISNKETENIIKQTIIRLENIPKSLSWKLRFNILDDIAKNFNDFILPYTGFNLIVEFKGKQQKEFINSKVVYDCINSTANVVFVMCITPSMYCVICLDNNQAYELNRDMNGLVLKGEKYDFKIQSRYIQPCKNLITNKYNWEQKNYTKIVTLPFNNITIPFDNIIKINENNRDNLVC